MADGDVQVTGGSRDWVMLLKVENRPGALTAIATAFSNRGISVPVILGSGVESNDGVGNNILLSFRSTERKRRTMERTLGRMKRVREVHVFSWDDERIRSLAVLQLSPSPRLANLPGGLFAETISLDDESRTTLLVGRPSQVESAVEDLREAGELRDLVQALLAL